MRSLLWGFGGIAVVALACGGTAVIDPGDGSGGQSTNSGAGAGATSTNASVGTTGPVGPGPVTTTGPDDCGVLGANLEDAIRRASSCNSCDDGPDPCEYFSGQELTDTCGCPAPVNVQQPDAAQAALEAYRSWRNAGCETLDCTEPCAITNDPTCGATGPNCEGSCRP